jgi:NAD-dependent SIR2 family protein deacetylase
MEDIKTRILNNEFKNIIVVTGAGVSTNSGIPDYRSPSGFFDDLKKEFNIQDPTLLMTRSFVDKCDIYDTSIYKERIKIFEQAIPTISHNFCKYLYDKNLLRRVYTQNIDGLHQKAGLPDDMAVEYHGSLSKNNVILYGDSIDKKVINQTINDFVDYKDVDLIIVMDTSLQVAPFCAIPNLVKKTCTRVLVDKTPSNCYKNNCL